MNEEDGEFDTSSVKLNERKNGPHTTRTDGWEKTYLLHKT